MPPSGAARDAQAERAAAARQMARRTERKMVRTSMGMAELLLDVPFEVEGTAALE